MHTNRHETVIFVQRPLILNGIPSLTDQADVARRAIVINLPSIGADRRQAEADFWNDFEREQPRVLGALLDAASCGLSNLDSVKLEQPGSMADFEKWSMASAPALGWTAEQFCTAYRKNENAVAEDTFEADPFAVAVHDFVIKKYPYPDRWEGSPAKSRIELDEETPEPIRKWRLWPKTPAGFGNSIKRAKPLLEYKGFTVERRHSGTRTITIVAPKQQPSGGSGRDGA
jgi:hypothetical protein